MTTPPIPVKICKITEDCTTKYSEQHEKMRIANPEEVMKEPVLFCDDEVKIEVSDESFCQTVVDGKKLLIAPSFRSSGIFYHEYPASHFELSKGGDDFDSRQSLNYDDMMKIAPKFNEDGTKKFTEQMRTLNTNVKKGNQIPSRALDRAINRINDLELLVEITSDGNNNHQLTITDIFTGEKYTKKLTGVENKDLAKTALSTANRIVTKIHHDRNALALRKTSAKPAKERSTAADPDLKNILKLFDKSVPNQLPEGFLRNVEMVLDAIQIEKDSEK